MPLNSLRGKSVLIILVVYGAVGLAGLAGFGLAGRRAVNRFGRNFAESRARLSREQVLAPLRREVALARKLADDPTLLDWIRSGEDPSGKPRAMAQLESFRRAFQDHSWFLAVDRSRHYYFNDAQGSFAGRELRYTLDPRQPSMAWYGEAMAKAQDFELHVDSSEQLGLLKVWINVAVWDGQRKVGLCGTGIALSGFLDEILRSPGAGTRTLLVDGRGIIEGHPDRRYMEYNARMKDESRRLGFESFLDREGDRAAFREALGRVQQAPDQVLTLPLRVEGRPVLASLVAVPEIQWVSVVLVDPGQVVGWRSFLPFLAILVLGLLATIALVSLLLDRVVLAPLARLTGSARAMARGDYELELPEGRDDEIGQLTGAFATMARVVREHMAHLEARVEARTSELREAHRELADSNRQLVDSLAYAQMIQASLSPREETLSRVLGGHFLMDRPRDRVGGDFLALFPREDGFLLAVADCTGHGVPGAIMTMCARSVLDQLVRRLGAEDPAGLLGEMNRAMKALLGQEGGGEALDNGLEMALLHYRPADRRLIFASARLPLWLLSGQGLRCLRGDRQSLGYRRSPAAYAFTAHELELREGELCCLFTDGILDQAGGEQGFGFGERRLEEALCGGAALSPREQGERLAEILAEFQGHHAQRDDILIIGFRP